MIPPSPDPPGAISMARFIDREALLEHLERIELLKEDRDHGLLEQISLADGLPALAKINHDQVYRLCRTVAAHLLGRDPEPIDADLGEE
jgi:heme oxygenase